MDATPPVGDDHPLHDPVSQIDSRGDHLPSKEEGMVADPNAEIKLPEESSDGGLASSELSSEVSMERIPVEPVFDGTEKPSPTEDHHGTEAEVTSPSLSESDPSGHGHPEEKNRLASAFDFATKGVDWPEKASAVRNFVKERGVVVTNVVKERGVAVTNVVKEGGVAVSKVIRRLSGKMEDLGHKDAEDDSPHSDSGDKPASSFMSFARNRADHVGYPKAGASLKTETGGNVMRGRITLFSKSGCQDSRAARSFLRRKGVRFVEINVDVFPHRRLELEERTGTSSAPQVFFNEIFIGGIDELNALEDKEELDTRLKEVFEKESPSSAPQPPMHGEDEPRAVKLDEYAEVVQTLRKKVEVKDRFHKMRLFSRCFVASEAVEVFAEDQYCERDEAVEYGRKIVAKHFFRHVLQENLFEDGNHIYRFFEHDPVISTKCFNFTGTVNDMEPMPVTEIEAVLRNFTHAIIDSYVSDDGKSVDYQSISLSEEYRRYLKMTEDLHRIDLSPLSREEKLAFFINLFNMMAIHAIITLDHPTGPLDRRRLFGDFQYVVGGYPFSLSAIQNGILRGNQRPPYQLIKPFGPKDKRLPVSLAKVEPLIHFALTNASRSSPALKCYSPSVIDAELRAAVRAFFLDGGVVIDMEAKTVSLTHIIKWYSVDFGKNDGEILRWLVNHLEPSKAEDLLELLQGNKFKVVYQPYDWSPNL